MKQGILQYYRGMFKKNRIPGVNKHMTGDELNREYELILAGKSGLSARQRFAIVRHMNKGKVNPDVSK